MSSLTCLVCNSPIPDKSRSGSRRFCSVKCRVSFHRNVPSRASPEPVQPHVTDWSTGGTPQSVTRDSEACSLPSGGLRPSALALHYEIWHQRCDCHSGPIGGRYLVGTNPDAPLPKARKFLGKPPKEGVGNPFNIGDKVWRVQSPDACLDFAGPAKEALAARKRWLETGIPPVEMASGAWVTDLGGYAIASLR